jgi:hypothetical protein
MNYARIKHFLKFIKQRETIYTWVGLATVADARDLADWAADVGRVAAEVAPQRLTSGAHMSVRNKIEKRVAFIWPERGSNPRSAD